MKTLKQVLYLVLWGIVLALAGHELRDSLADCHCHGTHCHCHAPAASGSPASPAYLPAPSKGVA